MPAVAMTFKDLPPGMRPREKLLARGAAALGDAELLALLLRTGLPGKNVLQMAQEVLERFGGLAGLLRASLDDLKAVGDGVRAIADFLKLLEGDPLIYDVVLRHQDAQGLLRGGVLAVGEPTKTEDFGLNPGRLAARLGHDGGDAIVEPGLFHRLDEERVDAGITPTA